MLTRNIIAAIFAAQMLLPKCVAGETSDGLVKQYLSPGASIEEKRRICARLAAGGDEAIGAILLAYGNEFIGGEDAEGLIETLGKSDAPSAEKALENIAALSSITPADILNATALCRSIYLGSTATAASSPSSKIWQLLDQEGKAVVTEIYEISNDASSSQEQISRLAFALNKVLAEKQFWDATSFKNIDAGKECADLIEKVKAGKFGNAAIGRINQLLLEAAYPTCLRRKITAPLPVYGDEYAEKALMVLASKQPVPDVLLLWRPAYGSEQILHIKALAATNDSKSVQILASYLTSDELAVSMAARRAMLKIGHENAGQVADKVTDTVEAMLEAGSGETKRHVAINALYLAAELSDAAGTRSFAECLQDYDNQTLCQAALEVLDHHLKLVSDEDIISSLNSVLKSAMAEKNKAGGRNDIIRILGILQKSGERKSIPLAAICLDSHNQQIAIRAAEVLQSLSGTNLGRNPMVWKKWYADMGK